MASASIKRLECREIQGYRPRLRSLEQKGVEAVSRIRKIAKSCAVLILGKECKPRRVLRGLASGYRMIVSPLIILVIWSEPMNLISKKQSGGMFAAGTLC